MDLQFNISLAEKYKSPSQIAKVLTEDWLARNMYCPVCGNVSIVKVDSNAPVKDYVCGCCKSQYELKSKNAASDKYVTKVADGVYRTMIDRIKSLENPDFLFMHYNNYRVNNLIIVPKCFFVPDVIEKRKPLEQSARRAGWEGCNILLGKIPDFAKIPIIKNGIVLDRDKVKKEYDRSCSLYTNNIEGRGGFWIYCDVSNVLM